MLEINNVEKSTSKKLVMANVNITLHEGEIFALVGEHASGKSLLSKIVLNLIRKTKGTIKVRGNKFLGAFIQNECLMPKDTVLTIIKDYCKINSKVYNAKRAKNILAVLNMKQLLHKPVYKLSPSEKDKLKIALPLIVRSDILILDAPFTNLNLKDARDLKVLLKQISQELKTAIIITALNMMEIEEICDTVGIIHDGMLVAVKSYNQMIEKEVDQAKLSVTVAQPNYAAKIIQNELKLPTKLCGDKVIINLKPEPAEAQKIVDLLVKNKISVLSVNKAYRSLQFQYLEIINKRKNFY